MLYTKVSPLCFPFQDIKSLQSLSVSGNWISLESLEATLYRVPTLEDLDIDHTGIVNVPNSLLQVRDY